MMWRYILWNPKTYCTCFISISSFRSYFGNSYRKNIVQAKEVKISSVQSKIATNIGIGEESWGSTVFAPYVDACSYPVFSLTEYAKETGTKHFILGFIVDKNGQPSWGTYYDMEEGPTDYQGGGLLKEIKALRQMGGDVMVSFGVKQILH